MRVSATTLQELMRCRRRFNYKYVERLSPKKEEESPALLFGSAFHKVLELYDGAMRRGADKKQAIADSLRDIVKYPLSNNHKILNWRSLVRSFVWYVESNSELDVIANEEEWELEVDGVRVTGTFDGFIEYFDGIYLLERKTSSSYQSSKIKDHYLNSFQIKLYDWAARKNKVPNYRGVYLDFIMVLEKSTNFSSDIRCFTEEDYSETDSQLKELIEIIKNGNLDLPSQTACMDFGRKCDFWDVCLKPKSTREAYIEENFVIGGMGGK